MTTAIPMYPCHMGIPNNVTARGWHHFQADDNGVRICIYCGASSREV